MGKVGDDKEVKPGEGPSWLARFPRLRGLSPVTAKRLISVSREINLASGSLVFQQGDPCLNYILLLRGSVRVGLLDSRGHEMTLYRLKAKDSCILTTASLLSSRAYSAFAVAETEVAAVLIPRAAFLKTLQDSAAFRTMVFADHGERLLDLMGVAGRLAFSSIDCRLAEKLEGFANTERVLRLTHEALAVELGTAREVVSRRLKHFSQKGWVLQSKGKITLLPKFFSDRRELGCIANSVESS